MDENIVDILGDVDRFPEKLSEFSESNPYVDVSYILRETGKWQGYLYFLIYSSANEVTVKVGQTGGPIVRVKDHNSLMLDRPVDMFLIGTKRRSHIMKMEQNAVNMLSPYSIDGSREWFGFPTVFGYAESGSVSLALNPLLMAAYLQMAQTVSYIDSTATPFRAFAWQCSLLSRMFFRSCGFDLLPSGMVIKIDEPVAESYLTLEYDAAVNSRMP